MPISVLVSTVRRPDAARGRGATVFTCARESISTGSTMSRSTSKLSSASRAAPPALVLGSLGPLPLLYRCENVASRHRPSLIPCVGVRPDRACERPSAGDGSRASRSRSASATRTSPRERE